MLNIIIVGYFIIVAIILWELRKKDKERFEESQKVLNEKTIIITIIIFLSIIVSLTISFSADVPNSYELGGLLWIFGPIFFGAITIIAFFILLLIAPKSKIYAGVICVMFNIGVGIYYYQLIE